MLFLKTCIYNINRLSINQVCSIHFQKYHSIRIIVFENSILKNITIVINTLFENSISVEYMYAFFSKIK